MRRLFALPATAALLAIVASVGWAGSAQASSGPQMAFQIADARAYVYKFSVPQPVVQVAPKCTNNPKQDKYHCQGYNHHPNCPKKPAIGPSGQPPNPQPPANVDGASGGAGEGAGHDPNGTGVPQSSAVRVNRLLSDGSLGREGSILTSNGLASLQYTELGTPPWESSSSDPDASHTETDAFTNQDNYEERCFPTGKDAKPNGDYAHMFSHSYPKPETSHFAECFQSQCQAPNGAGSPTANHGESEVHLWQNGGVVDGVMSAHLEHVTFFGGQLPLEISDLQTYVTFESDGTPSGLHWNVVTSAQGVTLGGQPLNMPEGQSIELGAGDQAASVGMAGPYVDAPKDGGSLTIVAPGFFVATSQQTLFAAGAELTANFAQSSGIPSFAPISSSSGGAAQAFLPPSTGTTSTGGGTSSILPSSTGGGGGILSGGGGGGSVGSTSAPPTQPQFALISKKDPPWAPVTIFALGLLGVLVVLLRWFQQFEWGRRMYEVQPVRSFQWLYRAFVKQ